MPQKDKSIPKEKWSVYFSSEGSDYRTPLGRSYYASCISWVSLRFRECSAVYNYSDYLKVAYRFWLEKIPSEEIIAFDKGLREKIESMQVQGYPWPE